MTILKVFFSKSRTNINHIVGFTLIELIVVIAIISILASIVLIVINPAIIFANARNATRLSDISTIQSAVSRYIAESPINALSRGLKDLSGYISLYAHATAASPQGNCPGGLNGTGLTTVLNPYSLNSSSNNQYSILLTPLINGGYLNKVLLDPLTNTSYLSCIDTTNNNQFIIYAKSVENNATIPVLSLGTFNPSVLVWDSFNRADSSSVGTADSGQTWATTLSSTGVGGIISNQMYQNQPGTVTSLIDSGAGNGNGDAKVTLINNVAGSYGILFRASSFNTYWYFGTNGSAQVQLVKFVNGTQIFAQGTGTNGQNSTYATLEVIYNNANITCKYNGATILNYVDPSAPTFNASATQVGTYGLGSNFWDNFTVTKP